jgi:hypothetical protein
LKKSVSNLDRDEHKILAQHFLCTTTDVGTRFFNFWFNGGPGEKKLDFLLFCESDPDIKKTLLFPQSNISTIFIYRQFAGPKLEVVYRLTNNQLILKKDFHQWLGISLLEPDILNHFETEFYALENYIRKNKANMTWPKMVEIHSHVKGIISKMAKKHPNIKSKLEEYRRKLWLGMISAITQLDSKK